MCSSSCAWTKIVYSLTLCFILQIASHSEVLAQAISYQTQLSAPTLIDPIAPSRPVGTLEGGMSVSGSGAATYSIPIKVVPGTMGVQPQLSLEYNSQSGNGQLGWGWNLSGLSAITRVGHDNYHDERVSPIEWNNNDFYSLDGSRLTLISGGGNRKRFCYGI